MVISSFFIENQVTSDFPVCTCLLGMREDHSLRIQLPGSKGNDLLGSKSQSNLKHDYREPTKKDILGWQVKPQTVTGMEKERKSTSVCISDRT